MSATCAGAINRAPIVRNARPSPICPTPSAARIAQSPRPTEPRVTNGAHAATTSTWEAHVAGIIDTSRRWRAITITAAKDAVIRSGSPTAARPRPVTRPP